MRALVTGGTRGIGEAIARGLARQGVVPIIAGRDRSRGEKVAQGTGGVFRELDQVDAKSSAAMVEWIRQTGGIDVLVNNAGATFDGFDANVARRTIETNFIGMMRLTDGLLSSIHPDGRIVMVSSGMGQVSCLGASLLDQVLEADLDRAKLIAFTDRFVADVAANVHRKNGWPSNAYRVSKVAMNAYVRILARELATDDRRILVNAACPGWVRTDMGGASASRSPREGADTPVWLALLPKGDPRSGGFYRDKRAIDW